MVDSKILEIIIEAIIKDPEIWWIVPDQLESKKMGKHVVEKLPLIIRYVSDQ